MVATPTQRHVAWLTSAQTCLLLVVVALAACAPPGGRTPSGGVATAITATHTPPPAIQPLPTVNPTALSLRAAWGNVPILKLPTRMDADHLFVWKEASSPDGQWLLGEIGVRNYFSNTTERSVLALYNVHTRQIVRIRELLQPKSQVFGANIDDDWITWLEAPDTPNFADWTLWAYNRHSGDVRLLAQATRINGQPVHGPWTLPVMSHGYLLYAHAIGPLSANDMSNSVVDLVNVATGETKRLATSGGMTDLSWPWASWGQRTSGDNGYMVIQNLETGARYTFEQQPDIFRLNGTSAVYKFGRVVMYLDDVTQRPARPRQLFFDRKDYMEFPSINDRIVAWGAHQSIHVYDRVLQRLVELPQDHTWTFTYPTVSGRLLVWLDVLTQETQTERINGETVSVGPPLNIVDTSQLPTSMPG